ncbi:MAG: diguanylate cyclase/phosphodiesterase [Rhizobium sp.]|nr:diguanylate cyclase/phosphodiesterase [Rhizobium sp.]
MKNDRIDSISATPATARFRLQNLAISGVTVCLFLLAISNDFYGKLQAWVNGDPWVQTGQKMRDIGIELVIRPETASTYSLDNILTFGLFASLGLSAFAFQQSWRLRRALERQQRAEQESRRLAMQDQLTGLANRRNFEEFGAKFLKDKARFERRAVLLIDLDHFKPVNDVYGHAAGDKVLADYAGRIEKHFPGGLVARFGGDEFAVITPPLASESEANGYARACIAGITEPFHFNDAILHLGASVGVALFGKDGDTIGEVLRRADIALYKAKHAGRHQVAFFESELEHVVKERNWIESELHKALKDNSIVPFFQPIVDLATRDVIGYEALARWRHAERGLISPAEFIPVAESCGLMAQLGEQMLRKASLAALTWPAHIKLSVNLSPVQLREKTLGLKIIGILDETGLSPHRLEVEITENALVADLVTARDTIDQLRAAGITIALDDFGTGHSTLQHLRSCKFDKLKIDRSFVASLQDNHESRLIVDAILGLSRSFGIRCTAEGIEEQAELDFLHGWGCTEGQGYLFGKPTEEAQLDGVRAQQAAA